MFTVQEDLTQFPLTGTFPRLEDMDFRVISKKISDDEIYNTIKSFGPFKAPGPDSFQAIFYQSQWQVIGPSLCDLIRTCFLEPWRVAE